MAGSRQRAVFSRSTLAGMEIQYTAIPAGRLDAMRAAGADEFQNKWQLRVAEGWEPLRCCLRQAEVDENIALICYSPWESPSPWMEAGPVFVHHDGCAGYAGTSAYPETLLHNKAILNPFDHTGARFYEHITFLDPDDDHEKALREVLEQPGVAFVHVRSGTAGCFHFLASK